MSKQLIHFQPEHQELLKKYLNFFSLKKEQCNKQIQLAIEDVEEDCLKSAFFTKSDVQSTFDNLKEEMYSTVKQELEMFYRMSGVFIQMMMHDAEQQNSTLKADVNYMENYKALEDIKDFENLQLASSGFSLQKKATITSKLPTLGTAFVDPNIANENQALKQENENFKRMIKELQAKLTNALQSRSQASEQIDTHKEQSNYQVIELENQLILAEEEKSQAKEQAENLRQELFNVKDELKKKVNQLTQVTNMKKMIQDKNSKIKTLRDRLGKYESVDEDDE
ncbi:UNKNOWN [Stylonychia lemnae]|uniref:Leucine zipper transcription factor-like protein 1 n=1 Tax=Stylonychia lemnae TaxID=5949 RepID=A0A078AXX6_STYLE|nr:UNKNOWN [Stylonychia lemnae]|eukprot:CDW86926.1 UNKNOWN [Stylonychia lemnae]